MSALVVAAGVVERVIDFGRAATNSDEALATLIARQLADGHVALFLWGQHYGGTPEAVPILAVTDTFGSSLAAQRGFTILLGCVAPVLLWRVAGRLVRPEAALLAALAFWIWPLYCVDWSLHEYLYYEPTVVLGLLALLCAYRSGEDRQSTAMALLCGLASGLGWWTNPNVAVFALPVLLILLTTGRARARRMATVAGGFVVAAAPWIVFNLRHHLESLQVGQLETGAAYSDRLSNVLHFGVSVLFGLRSAGGAYVWSYARVTGTVISVAAAATVGLVVGRWGWRRVHGSDTGRMPVDMIGLAAYPFVYALSKAVGGAAAYNPRYLFFGWPFAALLIGRFVSSRRLPSLVPAAVALVLGALALQQARLIPPPGLPPGAVVASTYDFPTLVRTLERDNATRVFTSYWNAYRINLLGDGAVIATPSVHNVARYRPFDDQVRSAPAPAWVFFEGSTKLQTFREWLGTQRLAATTEAVGGFVVVRPTSKVLPELVPVGALITPTEGQ